MLSITGALLCTVCCKPSHVSASLSLTACICFIDCVAYIMLRHIMAHFAESHISHLLHVELSAIQQSHVCLQEKVREVEHSMSQADAAAATTSTALDAETSRYDSSGLLPVWASMSCIGCMHICISLLSHGPACITDQASSLAQSSICMQVFRLLCMTFSVSNSLKKQAWFVFVFIFVAICIHVCGAARSLSVDMQAEGTGAAGAASGWGRGCHQGDPIWPHPQPPSTPLPLSLPVAFTHPWGRR